LQAWIVGGGESSKRESTMENAEKRFPGLNREESSIKTLQTQTGGLHLESVSRGKGRCGIDGRTTMKDRQKDFVMGSPGDKILIYNREVKKETVTVK